MELSIPKPSKGLLHGLKRPTRPFQTFQGLQGLKADVRRPFQTFQGLMVPNILSFQ